MSSTLPDTLYWNTYSGKFAGILTWADFDKLWDRLRGSQGDWYVYDLKAEIPKTPVSSEGLKSALETANALMTHARKRSYCGAVYVDDRETPGFVKIFDPQNMGSVCGYSDDPVFPRWIFSRIAPDPLPEPEDTAVKKGLFARIRDNV